MPRRPEPLLVAQRPRKAKRFSTSPYFLSWTRSPTTNLMTLSPCLHPLQNTPGFDPTSWSTRAHLLSLEVLKMIMTEINLRLTKNAATVEVGFQVLVGHVWELLDKNTDKTVDWLRLIFLPVVKVAASTEITKVPPKAERKNKAPSCLQREHFSAKSTRPSTIRLHQFWLVDAGKFPFGFFPMYLVFTLGLSIRSRIIPDSFVRLADTKPVKTRRVEEGWPKNPAPGPRGRLSSGPAVLAAHIFSS
ncbi:hypothetical protein B0H19DRAFT_126068 [Mycena capillaripes]|nr:hypothetical protein B0H19DRAFT_126068 [Mycena capillaripes]